MAFPGEQEAAGRPTETVEGPMRTGSPSAGRAARGAVNSQWYVAPSARGPSAVRERTWSPTSPWRMVSFRVDAPRSPGSEADQVPR